MGIHRWPVDAHQKGPAMQIFDVSLLLARTKCWIKSQIACDLIRHDAHVNYVYFISSRKKMKVNIEVRCDNFIHIIATNILQMRWLISSMNHLSVKTYWLLTKFRQNEFSVSVIDSVCGLIIGMPPIKYNMFIQDYIYKYYIYIYAYTHKNEFPVWMQIEFEFEYLCTVRFPCKNLHICHMFLRFYQRCFRHRPGLQKSNNIFQ